MCVHACVRGWVCARVHACERSCVRAAVCAYVRACVSVCNRFPEHILPLDSQYMKSAMQSREATRCVVSCVIMNFGINTNLQY